MESHKELERNTPDMKIKAKKSMEASELKEFDATSPGTPATRVSSEWSNLSQAYKKKRADMEIRLNQFEELQIEGNKLIEELDSWISSATSTTTNPTPTLKLSPELKRKIQNYAIHSKENNGAYELQEVFIATSEEEIRAALDLVAISIIEQCRIATDSMFDSHIMTMMVCISLLVGIYLEIVGADRITSILTCVAIIAASLKCIEYLTVGYLDAAKNINCDWLCNPSSFPTSEKDITIVWISKWKETIIGTLILRVPTIPKIPKTETETKEQPLIRAWTVKSDYRGIGEERALIHHAIRKCRESGWNDPIFANDYANSLRTLPQWFNTELDKLDSKAQTILRDELKQADREAFLEKLADIDINSD